MTPSMGSSKLGETRRERSGRGLLKGEDRGGGRV